MRYLIITLLVMAFCLSCKVEAEPIAYGSDICDFCSMTIVDQQHAAEMVTSKAKVKKFDAIECMMNFTQDIPEEDIGLYLCTVYTKPAELQDATQLVFLVSENIPSPMGENLTAFYTEEEALGAIGQEQGTVLSWESLKSRFKKK